MKRKQPPSIQTNLYDYCWHYALVGDQSQLQPIREGDRCRKRCVRKLRSVIKTHHDFDSDVFYLVWNETFFHSRRFKHQYLHGVKLLKRGDLRGFFSQGFGAWGYAEWLAHRRMKGRALIWAKRAEQAWQNYLAKVRKRADGYACLFMIYELLGEKAAATVALKNAQSCCEDKAAHEYTSPETVRKIYFRAIGLSKKI